MNWVGTGLITILNYGYYSTAQQEVDALLTENDFNILTESDQNILTES